MTFCANCGRWVSERFCASCGAPVGSVAGAATVPAADSQAAALVDVVAGGPARGGLDAGERWSRKRVLLVVSVVVAVLVGVSVPAAYAYRGHQREIEQQKAQRQYLFDVGHVLRDNHVTSGVVDSGLLLRMGHSMCASFARGTSFEDVVHQWTTESEPGPASETVDELTARIADPVKRSLAVGLIGAVAAGELCPVAGSMVVNKSE